MLGISNQPVHLQQLAHHGCKRGNSHTDKPSHDNSGSNNGGRSNGTANAIQTNQSKGILVPIDANKGIGVNNPTQVYSFPRKGQNRELCLKFTTRNCSCTYGSKCNKFHRTKKQILNFEPAN
jgi:hypothetical protein